MNTLLPFKSSRNPSLRRSRRLRSVASIFLVVLVAMAFEVYFHIRSFDVKEPDPYLDKPFAGQCMVDPHFDRGGEAGITPHQAPYGVTKPRENATILVLARNSDLHGTVSAIASLERQWNQWYNYPIILLNDEPWDAAFETAIRDVTKSELKFAQIPTAMWSWPSSVDRSKAEASWESMKKQGLPYVGREGYHHMCRFYSGFFYDHPALTPYKYYWRIEPDISFTCRIPYDPFRLMRLAGKIYGYTIALWEIGSTCPTLFRTTSNFKEKKGIPTTSLWTSMMDPSWAPFPLRQLFMSIQTLFHSRTRDGDAWNFCHFWSNFEIADMDFYRSKRYRDYFAELDRAGGFYTERWGDAAVHSLALGMLARPEQVHWFEDIGYVHPPFQHCPSEQLGCDCECSPTAQTADSACLRRLRAGVGRLSEDQMPSGGSF